MYTEMAENDQNEEAKRGGSSRERVILTPIGSLTPPHALDPKSAQAFWRDWPSQVFLMEILKPYRHLLRSEHSVKNLAINARRALLQTCGFFEPSTSDIDDENVQKIWEDSIHQAMTIESSKSNDLIQFWKDQGKSNQRQLEWALMDCAPGCQFQLHAHPNIELVYCVQGELHEVRLDDSEDGVLTTVFETTGNMTKNHNPGVIGPSLVGCLRPWRFGTLSQGQWLVNRVGTIHKSFTATKGDGCVLLALWGGSHADIPREPTIVTKALEVMDERLDCSCRDSDWIDETFLPDSEKQSSV